VSSRYGWFSAAARRAPYMSSLLIIAVGVYVGVHGWLGITAM
jgi:nickel/cobalt exporter